MVHHMRLKAEPFEKIKCGKKSIELRLYDEKRRRLNPGDIIIFTNLSNDEQQLAVKVRALYRYASFKDMFEDLEPVKCGNTSDCTIEQLVTRMRRYYTEDDENIWGVLGIKIELYDLNKALDEREAHYVSEFPFMLGAVCGDVAGSVYERKNIKYVLDPQSLISDRARFTDDSVMTLGVAVGIKNAMEKLQKYERFDSNDEQVFLSEIRDSVYGYGRKYPHAGYGGAFHRWLSLPDKEPYFSWGNGSAMRASYAGWAAKSLDDAEFLAECSAKITHNHPEGIKGARAVAGSIFLLRAFKDKLSHDDVKKKVSDYAKTMYDMNFTLDEIRPTYEFDVSCMGSVPQAIEAFLEGGSFAETAALAISIGGDSDTIAAIACSLAEVIYPIDEDIKKKVLAKLDGDFKSALSEVIDFLKLHG